MKVIVKRRSFLGVALVAGASVLGCTSVWPRSERSLRVPLPDELQSSDYVDLSDFFARTLRSNVHYSFVPGDYLLGQTLRVPRDVSGVVFEGRPGVRMMKRGDFPLMRLNGDRNQVHSILFSGRCSDAQTCAPDVKAGALILVNGGGNRIADSAFSGSRSNGVHLDGQRSDCINNVIERCVIRNNARVGVALAGASNIKITDCVIENSGFEALTLDLGTSHALISHNKMRRSNRGGGIGTIGYDRCEDVQIEANVFGESLDIRKPHIRAGNATGLSSRILIKGNRFEGGNLAIDLRGTVRSTAGTHDVLIVDNSFSQGSSNVLRVDRDDARIEMHSNRYEVN